MKNMKLPKSMKGEMNPRNMQVRTHHPPLALVLVVWGDGADGSVDGTVGSGTRFRGVAGPDSALMLSTDCAVLRVCHGVTCRFACLTCVFPSPAMQQNMAQMSRMLPPHMLKMMGGAGGLQNLMKQMEGKF